jgi:uncharacterized membrane protein YhdT
MLDIRQQPPIRLFVTFLVLLTTMVGLSASIVKLLTNQLEFGVAGMHQRVVALSLHIASVSMFFIAYCVTDECGCLDFRRYFSLNCMLCDFGILVCVHQARQQSKCRAAIVVESMMSTHRNFKLSLFDH